jgi:hypothetical protein
MVHLGIGSRMAVDWTQLPEELILSISKKITVYVDYVRFQAVCHRVLVNSKGSVPPPPTTPMAHAFSLPILKDTLCLEKQDMEIMEKEQETKQNKICEHGSQSTDVTCAQRIFVCIELILDM